MLLLSKWLEITFRSYFPNFDKKTFVPETTDMHLIQTDYV